MKKKYTAVAYTCFEMQKPDGRVQAKKTHRERGIRYLLVVLLYLLDTGEPDVLGARATVRRRQ